MAGVAEWIALGVVVVLLAVLVTVAWRVTRWYARTRRILAFRSAVAEISGRAESSLAPVAERIDLVRRATLAPEEIAPDLATGMTAVEAIAAQARELRGPVGVEPIVTGLVEELERAGRSLEMVEHGCTLMVGGHGRLHDPEAQTAVKRGYLNLLHAREAIADHAAAAAALPVTIPRFLAGRAAE